MSKEKQPLDFHEFRAKKLLEKEMRTPEWERICEHEDINHEYIYDLLRSAAKELVKPRMSEEYTREKLNASLVHFNAVMNNYKIRKELEDQARKEN
jgi:hypothetical protein